MQTVSSSVSLVNLVNPSTDATLDATDVGHRFGYEDATEDRDQAPSACFYPNTPAWNAYNEGYAQGCAALAVLTGKVRSYWLPPVAGDYCCQHCGTHFDPTYNRVCPSCGK